MRSIEEAEKWWPQLDELASLGDLRNAIQGPYNENSLVYGQRSVCWKALLLFEGVNKEKWTNLIRNARDQYASLRKKYLLPLQYPEELESIADPLSDVDNLPWITLRNDELRRQEIFQDVERCMPDNLFFREPATQNMLLDILFIWTKLNPDVGYRQGMHEILAPILWVIERDAIDPATITGNSVTAGAYSIMIRILDAQSIEKDAFALFNCVMQNAKSFYEASTLTKPLGEPTSVSDTEAPMLVRSEKIMKVYLSAVDPPLAEHLLRLGIVPQVFLMRWVRLLFGREFPFDDVLHLWDCIFASDTALKYVDLICVAMLLRIRWQLIEADHNTALTLLLRYSELRTERTPWTLVEDAMYLKSHLNFDGGHHLITKHTQRSPPYVNHDSSLATRRSSPGQALFSSPSLRPSLANLTQQSGAIESILQDAAREVYTQSEKWGVNKAVREAVGEVRKNVGEVRKNVKDLQTRHSRNSSVVGFLQTGSASELTQKIDDLLARNQALAKMLEGAVDELWKQQRDIVGDKTPEEDSMKDFTMAVAKVQFVQVYLADASLPLPAEEESDSTTDKKAPRTSEYVSSTPKEPLDTPPNPTNNPDSSKIIRPEPLPSQAINELQPRAETRKPRSKRPAPLHSSGGPISYQSTPEEGSKPPAAAPSRQIVRTPSDETAQPQPHIKPEEEAKAPPQSRPPLAQTSFSYMLGQETSAFPTSASPFMMDQQVFERRHRNTNSETAFLFGIENINDGDEGADGDSKDLFGRKVGRSDNPPSGIKGLVSKGAARRGSKTKEERIKDDEEAFRLGTWKEREKE